MAFLQPALELRDGGARLLCLAVQPRPHPLAPRDVLARQRVVERLRGELLAAHLLLRHELVEHVLRALWRDALLLVRQPLDLLVRVERRRLVEELQHLGLLLRHRQRLALAHGRRRGGGRMMPRAGSRQLPLATLRKAQRTYPDTAGG